MLSGRVLPTSTLRGARTGQNPSEGTPYRVSLPTPECDPMSRVTYLEGAASIKLMNCSPSGALDEHSGSSSTPAPSSHEENMWQCWRVAVLASGCDPTSPEKILPPSNFTLVWNCRVEVLTPVCDPTSHVTYLENAPSIKLSGARINTGLAFRGYAVSGWSIGTRV